jgi:hypothetical protein
VRHLFPDQAGRSDLGLRAQISSTYAKNPGLQPRLRGVALDGDLGRALGLHVFETCSGGGGGDGQIRWPV